MDWSERSFLYLAPHVDDQEDVQVSNPSELRPAITFGVLYGVILFVALATAFFF